VERGNYFAILPMLPELRTKNNGTAGLTREYSSADNVMTLEETTRLLLRQKLMPQDSVDEIVEVLR